MVRYPETMNPYLYGGSNPANVTDPSGKFWQFVIPAAIGAVIGGGVGAGVAIWQGRDTGAVLTEAGIGTGVGATMGALSGFEMTAVEAFGISMLAGGFTGAGGNLASQILVERRTLDTIDTDSLITSGIAGGVGGLGGEGLGQLVGPYIKSMPAAALARDMDPEKLLGVIRGEMMKDLSGAGIGLGFGTNPGQWAWPNPSIHLPAPQPSWRGSGAK